MTCFDIVLENFFTERTLVARPLPDTMSDETKKKLCVKEIIFCAQ